MKNENEEREIPKIKIDNQVYNIKDNEVRKALKELLGDDYKEEDEESSNNNN